MRRGMWAGAGGRGPRWLGAASASALGWALDLACDACPEAGLEPSYELHAVLELGAAPWRTEGFELEVDPAHEGYGMGRWRCEDGGQGLECERIEPQSAPARLGAVELVGEGDQVAREWRASFPDLRLLEAPRTVRVQAFVGDERVWQGLLRVVYEQTLGGDRCPSGPWIATTELRAYGDLQ